MLGRERRTNVEGRRDVDAEPALRLDAALRGETQLFAIEMRPEGDTILVELASRSEGKYLIPPRVGEDRALPAHETVKAAQGFDRLDAWAKEEMIRVGEHHLGRKPV